MLFDKVITSRKASTKMEDERNSQKKDGKHKSAILEEELESSPEKLLQDKTPLSNSKKEFRLTGASNNEKNKIRS